MATFTAVMRLTDQLTQVMSHRGTGELVAEPRAGSWDDVTVVRLEPVQTSGQMYPRG